MLIYFFIRDYVTIHILQYLFACVGAFLVCYISGGEISPHHRHVFDIIKKGENEDNISYCLSLYALMMSKIARFI